MNNEEILDGILDIIAKDDGLTQQFADGLDIDISEMITFLDNVELPTLL